MDPKEKKHRRIQEVRSLLDEFSKQHLSPQLSQYVIKLWDQIGRKRNYIITEGKKEVWASAVVYVIARLNFLFDKDNSSFLPPDTICNFFDTKKRTVSARASDIEKVFKIRLGHEDLCNTEISDSLTFVRLPNGLVLSKKMAKEMGGLAVKKLEKTNISLEDDMESADALPSLLSSAFGQRKKFVTLAKCSICNSRKGKRKCTREKGWVCSQCCGNTRQAERCQGCEFYRQSTPTRRYAGIPRFSTQDMASDFQLQSYADAIEGTLCVWDHSHQRLLSDISALRIIEMLLDKYYYHDSDVSCTDSLLREGFDMVLNSISDDLADVSEGVIVKILGVIHFVARRRSRGGREYLDVIQQYVGLRVGSGMRLLLDASS